MKCNYIYRKLNVDFNKNKSTIHKSDEYEFHKKIGIVVDENHRIFKKFSSSYRKRDFSVFWNYISLKLNVDLKKNKKRFNI